MSLYSLLADAIVVLHGLWVAVVVFGLMAILVGAALGWKWVRNVWFRLIHLTMIAVVVLETVLGIPCPLTVWEADLRRAAGQAVTDGTFIGRLVHNAIYFDAPPWAFAVVYCLFGLAVLFTMLWLPPHWPARWSSKRQRVRGANSRKRPRQGSETPKSLRTWHRSRNDCPVLVGDHHRVMAATPRAPQSTHSHELASTDPRELAR